MATPTEKSPRLTDTPVDGKPSFAVKSFGILWALLALATIFTYWQAPFLLTLASAFRFQLFLLLVAASIPPLLTAPKRTKPVILGVPFAIGMTFAGYFLPVDTDALQGPTLRVAVANVYAGNHDLTRLKVWLEENPCDVVGILEVGPHHVSALREMGYEHLLLEPRSNNFGIALLSREKPLEATVLERETPFPTIFAEYEGWEVLLTHPVPPINRELRVIGDEQVVRLAKLVKETSKPTLFMGDLNATGWDARVDALKEAGFRDARLGFGVIPTWPTNRPLLGIPIDHIFHDQHWAVEDCRRGPDIGSDHFPLQAELHPLP